MSWGIVVTYEHDGLACRHWLENNDGYGYKFWSTTTFDSLADANVFIADLPIGDTPMIPTNGAYTARRKS